MHTISSVPSLVWTMCSSVLLGGFMLFKITGALLALPKLPFMIFTGDLFSGNDFPVAEAFGELVSLRLDAGDVFCMRFALLIDFPCLMFRKSSMLNLTIFGLTSSSTCPICRRVSLGVPVTMYCSTEEALAVEGAA